MVFAGAVTFKHHGSLLELVLQTGIDVNGINSVCDEGTMSSSATYLLTATYGG